jgi:hypothetical protein
MNPQGSIILLEERGLMTVTHTTLTSLIDEADRAYQEARWKVWDQLAPGEPVNVSMLTDPQISALRNLAHAEAAVATYREFIYVTSPLRYDELSVL